MVGAACAARLNLRAAMRAVTTSRTITTIVRRGRIGAVVVAALCRASLSCAAVAVRARCDLPRCAPTTVWQCCISIVELALRDLGALLAVRRRAASLWYVALSWWWSIGGTALLLRFATAASAHATRRMLGLSLLLPCQLLCLLRLLLLLSASLPARDLLIVLV